MKKKSDYTFLCKRLRELREKNKLTLPEMAIRIGELDNGVIPNKSALSRVETGNTSEKTLLDMAGKYCEVFGMSEIQTEQFMRGERIAIPDTSALLKNSQLIDELNTEYNKVIVPKVVMDELDIIKDRNNNTTLSKKAWEIIRGIKWKRNYINGIYRARRKHQQ